MIRHKKIYKNFHIIKYEYIAYIYQTYGPFKDNLSPSKLSSLTSDDSLLKNI